jgi:glycogen(starch) synthase
MSSALGRRPVITHQGYQAICPTGLAWAPAGPCSAGPEPGPCPVCPVGKTRGALDVSIHRLAAGRASASVYVSRDLLSRVGLPGKMIYNMVAVPDRPASESGDDGWEVAFAGRLVREKGLDVLLTALRFVPDARLRVAGDGPLWDEWQRLAEDLDVASRVSFLGACSASEVIDLYARSMIVCVPSLWAEPFGYAAAEAMAMGRAVVGLPTGALPELLGDGQGFLADSVSASALAEALSRALGDTQLRRRVGRAARVFAQQALAADVIGEMYVDVYKR